VATQNPLEQHGTFPLPEGQLDRFAVRLRMGGLDTGTEQLVVREQLQRATVDDLEAVTHPAELEAARELVRTTHVSDPVLSHAVALVRATREHPAVRLGASSRAAVTLVRCAQAWAVLSGRDYVVPDDVKALATPVLAHRLKLHADGYGRPAPGSPDAAAVVAQVQSALPVPVS
jgi:MoxR-like ATPase